MRRLLLALTLLLAGPAAADTCNFNGTSSYARLSTAAATVVPLSMLTWVNTTSLTTLQELMGVYDSSNANTRHAMAINTSGQLRFTTHNGTTGNASTGAAVTFNSGVWNAAAGWAELITNRIANLNGVNAAASTFSLTPAGINRTSIGVQDNSTQLAFYNGKMHTFVVWNTAAFTPTTYWQAITRGWNPWRISGFLPSMYAECINGAVKDMVSGQLLSTTDITFTSDGPPMAFR